MIDDITEVGVAVDVSSAIQMIVDQLNNTEVTPDGTVATKIWQLAQSIKDGHYRDALTEEEIAPIRKALRNYARNVFNARVAKLVLDKSPKDDSMYANDRISGKTVRSAVLDDLFSAKNNTADSYTYAVAAARQKLEHELELQRQNQAYAQLHPVQAPWKFF